MIAVKSQILINIKYMINPVRYKKIIIPFILFSSSCMVTILMIELVIRIFFPEPMQPRFVINSSFGVRENQPNVRYKHYYPGEYTIVINTNNDGLRGKKNYSLMPKDNIYRIAILGDSHAFGYGCNDEEVVSFVLEQELNNNARRYEVLNFAVSGFGQAEELITYKEKVRNFNPDLVIIFYFNNDVGNDAVSNLFAFEGDSPVRTNNSYLPGVKAREIMYANPILRFLFEHSQAWNLIRNRLSIIIQKRLLSNRGLSGFDGTNHDQSKKLNKAVFLKLIDTINRDGVSVGVFIIPLRNLSSNFRFDTSELQNDVLFIIDGRKIFQSHDYYSSDGHLKPSGHRKAAIAIKKEIIDIKLQN